MSRALAFPELVELRTACGASAIRPPGLGDLVDAGRLQHAFDSIAQAAGWPVVVIARGARAGAWPPAEEFQLATFAVPIGTRWSVHVIWTKTLEVLSGTPKK